MIDRSGEDELKRDRALSPRRDAVRRKQYDDALRTLDAKHDEPFVGLYADLRGDILAAAAGNDEARAAYQAALAKLDPKSQYQRTSRSSSTRWAAR